MTIKEISGMSFEDLANVHTVRGLHPTHTFTPHLRMYLLPCTSQLCLEILALFHNAC